MLSICTKIGFLWNYVPKLNIINFLIQKIEIMISGKMLRLNLDFKYILIYSHSFILTNGYYN